MKVIAMYLPQFHEIQENNKWWGEGFTEWTAVKRAEKLFEGHMQPHIPYKHFYYNLLDKEVMKQQEEWMKTYTIDGLCFYHYYFKGGRKILEKPAENLLKWQDIDMPFCFCWANPGWARTWSNIKNQNHWSGKFEEMISDKGADGILIEQKYGREEEWKQHFNYLLPFFMDKRYIKKNGAPLFLIYEPEDIPNLYQMINQWRVLAKGHGIPDIYFIGMNMRQKRKGLDALLLNAPTMFFSSVFHKRSISIQKKNGVTVYPYHELWENIIMSEEVEGCKTYFGGFINYDDTPRHGKKGVAVEGASAEKFKYYIKQLIEKNLQIGNEYLFLNAWNEWGEGMYLEPDEVNGFAYLEVIQEIKKENRNYKTNIQKITGSDKTEREKNLGRALQKYKHFTDCFDQWMLLLERNIHLSDYLKRYGYYVVAIYGVGVLGKHLLKQLEEDMIEIKYVVDQRNNLNLCGVEVRRLEDNLPKVDAILVTVVDGFEEIYDSLINKVEYPIVSLMEIIKEMM